MRAFDLWLVSFALRSGALVLSEIACFIFVIPSLFNLHSDLADAGAAVLALLAVIGGFLGGSALNREWHTLLEDRDK